VNARRSLVPLVKTRDFRGLTPKFLIAEDFKLSRRQLAALRRPHPGSIIALQLSSSGNRDSSAREAKHALSE